MGTIALADLSEKHYSRQIAGDIGEICEPLKEHGIVHFTYSRFLNDGTNYTLTNTWEPYYHHCKKQYSISPSVSISITNNKFFYLPGNTQEPEYKQATHDWKTLFNIGHPIYFIEYQKDYLDLIIYASTPENYSIIDFYLNNIDILLKFKFYFKDKARALMLKSAQNRILLPKEMGSNFYNVKKDNDHNYRKKLLEQLEIKNYYLPNGSNDISISKREIDVIRNLANGCTFKETGKTLEISPRTVETHLNNIKSKLKMHKKSDIIKIIANFNLLEV